MLKNLPYTAETRIYIEDGVERVLRKEDLPLQEQDFYYTLTKYREVSGEFEDLNDKCPNMLRDVVMFENMPELVCLYRGANKREEFDGFGQSWSLSRKIAEFFAYDYYSSWSFKGVDYFDAKNRCVFMAFVPREHILMYCNDRNEFECVLELGYKPTVEERILIGEPTTHTNDCWARSEATRKLMNKINSTDSKN